MESVPLGPPLPANLIASPAYLTQKGKPNHPSGLIRRECIGLRRASTGMVERWELRQNDDSLEVAVTGRLIVNDSVALVQAALDRLGVAKSGLPAPGAQGACVQRRAINHLTHSTGEQLTVKENVQRSDKEKHNRDAQHGEQDDRNHLHGPGLDEHRIFQRGNR
jgi:DNA-binding transcriptional LysR family regulator